MGKKKKSKKIVGHLLRPGMVINRGEKGSPAYEIVVSVKRENNRRGGKSIRYGHYHINDSADSLYYGWVDYSQPIKLVTGKEEILALRKCLLGFVKKKSRIDDDIAIIKLIMELKRETFL